MRKLTTEEFIRKAREVHGEKYDYSKVVYINATVKVIIGCIKHGDFKQLANNHFAGRGCPECGKTAKILTTEEFIRRAKKIHGSFYDYSKSIYKNSEEDLIIICPIHGEFWQSPSHHINSKCDCPECAGHKKLNTEEFIKRAIKVHGNKYSYDKTIFINSQTKVTIGCKEHGDFLQIPNSHINEKTGCFQCGRNVVGLKLSSNTEKFIKKARKIHGDKYDYSQVVYKNSSTKVIIICRIHGKFLQNPNSHINKTVKCGCPFCAGKMKWSTEDFIKKAREVHGDTYDYSLVVYKNSESKVVIICPIHGKFFQSSNAHINRKHGCPHCKKSKGESILSNILDKKHINYIHQKRFYDCINPKTNRKLAYDFFIQNLNVLIEYNGIQHYKDIPYLHRGKFDLESQQYRDNIKKEYALSHGYKFLVIKYTDDIEEILKKELNL